MSKHYDVFISYARPDREVANKLAASLEDSGIEAWTDTELRPGDDFVVEIDKAMTECRVAILLLSPNYLSSDWGNYERALATKLARDTGKPLVPVILEQATAQSLPPALQRLHVLDGREGAEKIAAAVKRILEKAT